ncbi:MAG TPA: response regulator [Geobacteraceae bacterium]|nr:response regulator [Geobacteraceae bacterium]
MSLVGNLEDLGLGEILQIVSLSRKSGILSLYSKGREGKIVFRQGQVIQAAIDGNQPQLGKILLERGLVSDSTLRAALTLQAEEAFRERLGDILVNKFSVRSELIEEIVRERIERVVYSLFSWEEGSFDFELRDTVDETGESEPKSVPYLLEQGLNPQFLAMEGSRILDERRHRGESTDDDVSDEDAVPLADSCDLAFDMMQGAVDVEPEVEHTPHPKRIAVLVDDDDEVRAVLVSLLEGWGYTVYDFPKTEDTLIKVDFLRRDGFRPTVIVDLIMPRMDGSGILGGLELIELLHDNFPDMPVIVLADHHTNNAEQKVRETGYPFLLKPRKSEISHPETFQSFSEKLRSEMAVDEPKEAPKPSSETINLGDELFREMGEDFVSVSESGGGAGVSLLRGMLEELNNPALEGGITLLVLRFATEFMNRAVVFLVGRDGIRGLGQFGVVDPDGHADARVRDLFIPLKSDPFFSRAIDSKMAIKAPPDGTEWNRYLLNELGGGTPEEMFLGPVISEGKVVALLYGDNLPERRTIGDTDSLEIFLSQAGLAMEKCLLQQRLKEKNQE